MALQPDRVDEADDLDRQLLCLPDLIDPEFPEVSELLAPSDVPPEVRLHTVRNGCQSSIVILLTTPSLMNTTAMIPQTFLGLPSRGNLKVYLRNTLGSQALLIRDSSMPLVKYNPSHLSTEIVRLLLLPQAAASLLQDHN
jgi:hypothetical protein